MVIPFTFSRLPLIHFGPGKLDLLPGLISKYGTSLMLVAGKGSFLNSEHGIRLMGELNRRGISVTRVIIPGEPSPGIVDDAVVMASSRKIEVVAAIGGGSAIDAGKAISAMLPLDENLKDYLEGVGEKEHPGLKVPFIAVPTTSGTGSEATKNAVISEVGEGGFKKSLRHENLVPDAAIVDPLLTVSCPPYITAASGMDCFTQLTEAFLSDRASPYTDAFAVDGIRAVISSLLSAYKNGSDIEARTGMAFAALNSGICLANAGLGAVHGFASSIGALYDIPHGVVCGTLMARANEVNVRVLRETDKDSKVLDKYEELGKLILAQQGKPRDFYIDGFIGYLFELTEKLQLPSLGRFGVTTKEVDAICRDTDIKNNPVKLNIQELAEILESRI